METRKRTLLKAVTFRIIATITTFILVLAITGDLLLASSIGAIDIISKIFVYYVHERAWESVAWGMKKS